MSPRAFSRPLSCVLVALALLPAAARADDVVAPRLTLPVDPSLIAVAHDMAVARWGVDPCRGEVAVTWEHLGAGINARSQWLSLGDPSTYSGCAIAYSLDVNWDWPKLCTVVQHELGHLAGHEHVNDPHDVMSPYYEHPAIECNRASPDAPATVATATATKKTKAKSKSSKAAKRSSRAKAKLPSASSRARVKASRHKQARSRARGAGWHVPNRLR